MIHFYADHPVVSVAVIIILILFGIAVCEALYIKYAGKPVLVPDIPRGVQMMGAGDPLTYAILGDSTVVGQGGEYEDGIALSTARFMAVGRAVRYQNFAVSGARTADVLRAQTGQAAALKPDVILLAVGANDVTHVTPLGDVKRDMAKIIDALYVANPEVKIILTGSPQMGSVPRFPWPVSYFATLRTAQVNNVVAGLVKEKGVIFAPIAAKTGPIFKRNPSLFAQDKFHPNTDGYNVWVPVLEEALTEAGLVPQSHNK